MGYAPITMKNTKIAMTCVLPFTLFALAASCGGDRSPGGPEDAAGIVDASVRRDAAGPADASVGPDASVLHGLTDGTWDGTFTLLGDLRAVQATVSGPTLTMTLIRRDEGLIFGSCNVVQLRYEITASLQRSVGTGALTETARYVGAGCPPSRDRVVLRTFNIQRTAGTGTSLQDLSGSWELTTDAGERAHLALVAETLTGDFLQYPGRVTLRFGGALRDLALGVTTDSGGELAASRR